MPKDKTGNQKGRLVSLGGLYTDIVMVVDDMPNVGEYVYGKKLHFIPGGNGLNVATAASRLGARVSAAGFIGSDSLGKELVSFMKSENIDTSYIKTIKNEHSGTIVYLLADKAERHLVFTGSNMKATPPDLPEIDFSKDDIVTSQLAIPPEVTKKAFEKAKAAGSKTILNLFPNYEVSDDLMALSDYIILNEVELAFRTGDTKFVRAQHKDLNMTNQEILTRVKKMRKRPDQTIIVTLAERGVAGVKDDSITSVSGIKVKFADATGAGDCFLGAFSTALTEGKDFRQALEFANCAAAISVQTIGATTSFPSRNEVDALLNKQK